VSGLWPETGAFLEVKSRHSLDATSFAIVSYYFVPREGREENRMEKPRRFAPFAFFARNRQLLEI
jgi:hypothetical protein